MASDFSRKTFDPRKHYSGVLQQQGRVQLDADWNEQLAIGLHRSDAEARDVVGPCGVPKGSQGFMIAVTPDGGDLGIAPGHLYVDGILCELESNTTYITQPDYPNPESVIQVSSPPVGPPTSPPGGTARLNLNDGNYLVYIDVWRREVNALDDPLIREKALGGPDTTTRLKIVWQVKLWPLITSVSSPPTSPPGETTCETPLPEWEKSIAPATGLLNARTVISQDDNNPCLLPPKTGYSRLENQLYRVEVHRGGDRDQATFKWSRDNASVETSVLKIDGAIVTVSEVGKDQVLGFKPGDWVELIDGEAELQQARHPLMQIDTVIDAVNAGTREITLKASLAAYANKPRLKLRRWDQSGASATTDGVVLTADWLDLEAGIQVQFSSGSYHSGDYWLIPARTATGEIEWPPHEIPNVQPVPQKPTGIQHHYCRLALLKANSGILSIAQDCREEFPPLTNICAEDVCFDNAKCDLPEAKTVQDALDQLCRRDTSDPSIHITQVLRLNSNSPILNDSDVPAKILRDGIRIICDRPIDPNSINRATCFLSMEIPRELLMEIPGARQSITAYQPLVIPAELRVEKSAINWVPKGELEKALLGLPSLALPGDRGILARLVIKGNFVWAQDDQASYLDGEGFGFHGERPANTDIRLPSGNGRRGGDFEMWFWLVPPLPTLTEFSLDPAIVNGPAAQVPSTGTVALNAEARGGGASVTLSISDPAHVIDTIPGKVQIEDGKSKATFTLTLSGAEGTARIIASLNESSLEQPLTVSHLG